MYHRNQFTYVEWAIMSLYKMGASSPSSSIDPAIVRGESVAIRNLTTNWSRVQRLPQGGTLELIQAVFDLGRAAECGEVETHRGEGDGHGNYQILFRLSEKGQAEARKLDERAARSFERAQARVAMIAKWDEEHPPEED